MRIIDISWPISNQITTYKNKNDVQIEMVKKFEIDGCREARLNCGVHTGTHVDAPAHFLQNGATVDQVDLSNLIGPCQLFDLTHIENQITAEDLKKLDFKTPIILFKTRNSLQAIDERFDPLFVYLDGSAAKFLAHQKLTAIGIDGLGVERNQPNHETHIQLLKKQISIIEGLRLAHVTAGMYQLICLPLNLIGTDAAPARAVLIQQSY